MNQHPASSSVCLNAALGYKTILSVELDEVQGIAYLILDSGQKLAIRPTLQGKPLDKGGLSFSINDMKPPMIGYNPELKLFAFGDCGFLPDGTAIFSINPPDHLSSLQSRENQFAQGKFPVMFPETSILGNKFSICESLKDSEEERNFVSKILNDFITLLSECYGKDAATVMIYTLLSYPGSPSTIKKYNAQAGIWLHGGMGCGKTETARLLMQLAGYPKDYSIITMGAESTATAADNILCQACSWPIHIDEFKTYPQTVGHQRTFTNAYNRLKKSKGKIDGQKTISPTPMTMPIVCGESLTSDAATRSRFVCVLLDLERKRNKEGFDPLLNKQKNRYAYDKTMSIAPHLYRVTRWIMMNLGKFTEEFEQQLDVWMHGTTASAQIENIRTRTTYAGTYAAAATLNKLLFNQLSTPPAALGNHIVRHIKRSEQ